MKSVDDDLVIVAILGAGLIGFAFGAGLGTQYEKRVASAKVATVSALNAEAAKEIHRLEEALGTCLGVHKCSGGPECKSVGTQADTADSSANVNFLPKGWTRTWVGGGAWVDTAPGAALPFVGNHGTAHWVTEGEKWEARGRAFTRGQADRILTIAGGEDITTGNWAAMKLRNGRVLADCGTK